MLRSLLQFAKKSKTVIVLHLTYHNWRMKRRFRAGRNETFSGSTHANKTLQESLYYINEVFDDYLTYSGISLEMLRDKRILEIGPGDNFGVALKFLVAGAKQVVCLDKFYSKRDWKQQHKIYQALREQYRDEEREIFDEMFRLESCIEINPKRLVYIHGTGIEEAEEVLEPASFDYIISRAVMEHLRDPERALFVMDRLLFPGGLMIHKIDLRDHELFSDYGHHPLTFLTIPPAIYKLMTYDAGEPNRKLVPYYRRKLAELGYETKIFVTHIIGEEGEVLPHKETIMCGIDYTDKTLALLSSIRPHLQTEFRTMSDEDLVVSGIFLVGRKPLGG